MLSKNIEQEYQEVYAKAKVSLHRTLNHLRYSSMSGGFLDLDRIYTMNSIMLYLKLVKDSSYEYYYIPRLDDISNTLNKI